MSKISTRSSATRRKKYTLPLLILLFAVVLAIIATSLGLNIYPTFPVAETPSQTANINAGEAFRLISDFAVLILVGIILIFVITTASKQKNRSTNINER